MQRGGVKYKMHMCYIDSQLLLTIVTVKCGMKEIEVDVFGTLSCVGSGASDLGTKANSANITCTLPIFYTTTTATSSSPSCPLSVLSSP